MNRRAFLSAIAGAVVAPHVRLTAAPPEPRILVTYEWLCEMNPAFTWQKVCAGLPPGWVANLPLDCIEMPLSDARDLVAAYADRTLAENRRFGFIGVRFSSQYALDAGTRRPYITLHEYRDS